ncbi:MAG: class I SAM-dependent methyltransferase [Hyphomicrobiales bacterium]
MTPLGSEIVAMIAADGPISVERYMRLALSHPRFAYYRSGDPFGASGDFVTAPEISQMFGELIGLWAADCWDRMGRPERFGLVELGPGRGTLMADALRAARIVAGFHTALEVHLVETSEVLRARQRQALAERDDSIAVPVFWHERFDTVARGPLIVIANEFFDALPICQYVRTRGGWRERLVGLDDHGALSFGLSARTEPSLGLAAPLGAVLEIRPDALTLARDITLRLVEHGGAALVIDYGHVRQGLGDTLQAVRKHGFADPLSEPGETDLTAHVDFATLALAAREAGAVVHGPMPQGAFLRALGIEARAQRLNDGAKPPQAAAIDAALARLTGDGVGEMGALFKAMAIADPSLSSPAGFGLPEDDLRIPGRPR